MISLYDWLLLLHVLLFVYWLGADLAVLYASRYAADQSLSIETRVVIARITGFIDLFPRLSVPLIGAVGVSLAWMSGVLHLSRFSLILVWLASVIWVVNNLYQFIKRQTPQKLGRWKMADVVLRLTVAVVAAMSGVSALAGLGPTDSAWLAVKLLIFAAAIFLSLVLRVLFLPYRPALSRIANGTGRDSDNALMQQSLARARPVVLAIWSLTVAATAIGLWKPF